MGKIIALKEKEASREEMCAKPPVFEQKRPEPRFKGQELPKVPRPKGLTCGNGSGVQIAPLVVEEAVVPVPPATVPVQAPDVQAAVRFPVDGAPEVQVAGLPLLVGLPRLGDEVGVGEEVVEHLSAVDLRELGEPILQLVPDDGAARLLGVVEVEADLRGIELEFAGEGVAELILGADLPAFRDVRLRVAVDEVGDHLNLCVTAEERDDLPQEVFVMRQLAPVFASHARLAASDDRLVQETEILAELICFV